MTASETPAVFTLSPAEAGELIGKTGNWMKDKARAGTIPCTRIGLTIRFTPAQVAEIVRMHEQRPRAVLVPRVPVRRRAAADAPVLEARTPRRKRPAA